jgi:hypothetical protein
MLFKNSLSSSSGLLKVALLVLFLVVLTLSFWLFNRETEAPAQPGITKSALGGTAEAIDLIGVKKELAEIKEQQAESIQQLYQSEKELKLKDEEAQLLIDRLQQQPGMSEDEFQQRYGELLGTVSK